MIHDKSVTATPKSFNGLFNTDRVPECSIESMLFLTDDSNNSQGKHEYVTTESMLRANPDNFDTDGNHLAPNGKPSNLTYEQWVQVRTPAFKKWFGDWEKPANYNWLMRSLPIATLTGEEFKENLVDNVTAFYSQIGNRIVRPGLGEVTLTRHDIQSSVAHGIGRAKAVAFAAIPDVIKQGREFNRTENYKGRGYSSITIAAPISINGEDFICEVVINQRSNSNNFYLHEVEIKEKLQFGNQVRNYMDGNHPNRNTKTGASRLIISKLLAEGKFNSSKVVDENGEPKVVYHGTSEIFDTFDRSKLGTSTDASSARLGFFFIDNIDTAISYGTWAIEKNVQKMFTQAEVLGRKGKWDTEALSSQAKEIMLGNDDRDTVVMPLFLNIRNPLWLDAEGDTSSHFDSRLAEMDTNGHNGIIVKNLDDNINGNAVANHFVAFSRNQIKSATNNRGTFANENPNILFQPTFKDAVDSQIDAITEQSIGLLNKTLRISERTPVIFRPLGFPDLPVEMYVDKLARGLFLDKAYSHGHADGLTKDAVKQVVHHFADPWLVFNSTHGEGNLVAVYYVFDKNEDPIMISLRANVLHNRSIEINLLTSIYGRPEQQIQNWVDRGLLLYRDDQTKSSTRLRLQLPSVGAVLRSDASVKRILYKSQLVNSGLNEVQQ